MPLYQYRKNDIEKTFLFIHVPKTGGTAVETFFRGIGLTGYFDPPTYMPVRPYLTVPPAHYDYAVLRRLFNLDELYSFAIVRDPVKRMISQYKWSIEKSSAPVSTISMPNATVMAPFGRFVLEQSTCAVAISVFVSLHSQACAVLTPS